MQRVVGVWRTVLILDVGDFNKYLLDIIANLEKLEKPCRRMLRRSCEELIGYASIKRKILVARIYWEELQGIIRELIQQNLPRANNKTKRCRGRKSVT